MGWRINGLDLTDPSIKQLFLKHGTDELYEKSEVPLAETDSDLEFPDWSGMKDSPDRISPEAAFRLCDDYAALFREQAAQWRLQAPEKCLVQFEL